MIARRLLAIWILATASFAVADPATLAAYQQRADAVKQDVEKFSAKELTRLPRALAHESFDAFRRGMDFLREVAREANLDDAEKKQIALYAGNPVGALAVRLCEGFVDAQAYDRTFSSMRKEGRSWYMATYLTIRDFFVNRELHPYFFTERERWENPWADKLVWLPLTATYGLIDRMIRLVPTSLRQISRLVLPGQWIDEEYNWSVPPAWPFFGSDWRRNAYAKDMMKEVRYSMGEAFKDPKNAWALAVLIPVLTQIRNAEPFKLRWTNHSTRNWLIAAALYFVTTPVELTARTEMGPLIYGIGEFIFFMGSATVQHISAGMGVESVLRPMLQEIDGDGAIASQYQACAAKVADESLRAAPSNSASARPRLNPFRR